MKYEIKMIEGVRVINLPQFTDKRGKFIKILEKQNNELIEIIDYKKIKDEYITHSHRDVIRGMHFQAPPSDHFKIISCIYGEAIDVLIDIRFGKNYGLINSFKLNCNTPQIILIPTGVAHGFVSKSELCIMSYKTTSPHDPKNDHTIRFDTIGFEWNIKDPIISERDKIGVDFKLFETPFK